MSDAGDIDPKRGSQPAPASSEAESSESKRSDEGQAERENETPAPPSGEIEQEEVRQGPHPPRAPNVHARVDIGEAAGAPVENAGIKYDYRTQYQYFGSKGGSGSSGPRDLVRGDFTVLTRERLEGILESYLVPDDDLDLVTRCLERHRLALVVGDRGLGKGALSQVAAARFARGSGLQSVNEALVAERLDPGVRVKPDTFFDGSDAFRECVVVLEDALNEGDESLRRWLERLDPRRIEELQKGLKEAASYLLLTSEAERLPGNAERLRSLGILVSVSAPPVGVLVELLHRWAYLRQETGERRDAALHEAVQAVLKADGERLAEKLRTPPRVAEFAQRFLEPVARRELTTDEALERLDDLEPWLLAELPENRPVWCFVLALALASSNPRIPWVPWAQLYRLWREMEAVVEEEVGDRKAEGPRPLSRLVVDRAFLAQARAEAQRRPHPMGEAVRFKARELGDGLWKVLLGGGRSILATLEPRLRELARAEDSPVSVLAARAMGRIGELDPRTSELAKLDSFLESAADDGRLHGAHLAGEILVGAQGSKDSTYFLSCLQRFRAATAGPSREKAAAAVAALVPLGAVDPDLVLEILWEITRARVGEAAAQAAPLKRRVEERLEALARGKEPAPDGSVLLAPREAEQAALGVLGELPTGVLDGLQFTLVGLCLDGEPNRVLSSMARWIRSGDAALAPWLALLALRSRGVLRLVETFHVRPPLADKASDLASSEGPAVSRILLAVDEEEVRSVIELLAAAHTASGPYPRILRSWLRRSLMEVVTGWLQQGAEVPLVRPRVVAILSQLLDAPDQGLREAVFRLLDREAGSAEEARRDLAREVLRAGIPGGEERGTPETVQPVA